MGRSGLKAQLLGFCSSGSQHNHLPLKSTSQTPTAGPLDVLSHLSPQFCSGPQGLGSQSCSLTVQVSLSHTLCQPLVGPVYLAADCQLQGGPSIALAVLKPFARCCSLKRQRTPPGATS